METSSQSPLVSIIENHAAFPDDSLAVIREHLKDRPHQLFCNMVNSGQPRSQWLSGIKKP